MSEQALTSVILADLLHVARARGASDIHITPGEAAAIRTNGVLERLPGAVLSRDATHGIAAACLLPDELDRVVRGADVSRTLPQSDAWGFVRIHAFRVAGGIAVAIRLLHCSIPSLDSLELPPAISLLLDHAHGLVVVAGPTGSGKSTTLAALIDRINQLHAKRIVTVEDPIEYLHASKRSSIVQREVGRDVETYEGAVLGALRADPDVVVLGEMRDRATMRAALTAAETGHLVMTTLHTGDAVQTIERIVDAFPGEEHSQVRIQLAQALAGVICQRLVNRADGCGRRAAVEVMVANDAVRSLVRDGKAHQLRNVILTSRAAGMQSLEDHLSHLMRDREITESDARNVALRPEELQYGSREWAS